MYFVYQYYLYKEEKHCFHKCTFPNECKMNLITNYSVVLTLNVQHSG